MRWPITGEADACHQEHPQATPGDQAGNDKACKGEVYTNFACLTALHVAKSTLYAVTWAGKAIIAQTQAALAAIDLCNRSVCMMQSKAATAKAPAAKKKAAAQPKVNESLTQSQYSVQLLLSSE